MFPTFTGNSRRPRNVNLSGQRSVNPFASSAGSGSATTKSVADAAAERRQRQHERDRKQAAQKLQRVWRGQRVRRRLRSEYRTRFDELYTHNTLQSDRLPEAITLLMFVFDATLPQDLQRLAQVANDLDGLLDNESVAVRLYDDPIWVLRTRRLSLALRKALELLVLLRIPSSQCHS